MTHVTCRLTTKNQDQLQNPMLGSQVWATLCLYLIYLLPRDTHAHTRLTALCTGLPGWVGTRKVKPIWILLKQETVSGSGISCHVQVCTSLQTDNHAHTPPLSFLQAGCPSCRPTNSIKALKACKLLQREHVLIISAELLIMCWMHLTSFLNASGPVGWCGAY